MERAFLFPRIKLFAFIRLCFTRLSRFKQLQYPRVLFGMRPHQDPRPRRPGGAGSGAAGDAGYDDGRGAAGHRPRGAAGPAGGGQERHHAEQYRWLVHPDASAPGGSAAHGVCPPARALRAAVTAEGFDLPVGMCWDEDAVLFGYNPTQGILVYNNHDYPVQLKMWTEGEGTGMGIYAQIVRYIPNN